jgi:hypothetical protein
VEIGTGHCYMWFYTCHVSFLFRIKKHIWPNVPDPSKSHIAQWSPHTPPRVRSSPPELFVMYKFKIYLS